MEGCGVPRVYSVQFLEKHQGSDPVFCFRDEFGVPGGVDFVCKSTSQILFLQGWHCATEREWGAASFWWPNLFPLGQAKWKAVVHSENPKGQIRFSVFTMNSGFQVAWILFARALTTNGSDPVFGFPVTGRNLVVCLRMKKVRLLSANKRLQPIIRFRIHSKTHRPIQLLLHGLFLQRFPHLHRLSIDDSND